MKSYSADAVTPEDITRAVSESAEQVVAHVNTSVSVVDAKQTRQIVMLRWAVGLSFVVNALLAIFL